MTLGGLQRHLNFEEALQLTDLPQIAPRLVRTAWDMINDPLFVRIKEQVEENDPSEQINAERQRELNMRRLAAENDVNHP